MHKPLCLLDMPAGHSGKIVELATENRAMLTKLMSLGIVPGISVGLLRRYPGFILQVGYTLVALDHSFAELIYILL